MLAGDLAVDQERLHHHVEPTLYQRAVVIEAEQDAGNDGPPQAQSDADAEERFPGPLPDEVRHEEGWRDLAGDSQRDDQSRCEIPLAAIAIQSGDNQEGDEKIDVAVR